MTDHRLTAIDIALKPGDAMVRRARADNERLLKAFPEFFALDATHHPHMTMIQQFVRTAELDKVAAAAGAVLGKERITRRKLKATGYYYIPTAQLGIAGVVVELTDDLVRIQRELLDAIAPFTERSGTPAAFYSTENGRDIQPGLIDYVADFVTVAAGDKFNPHVTIGVAPIDYLDKMFKEPFKGFTFSAVGAAVFHLGTFGAVRKELRTLALTP